MTENYLSITAEKSGVIAFQNLPLELLRVEWQRRFGPPPKHRSPELLAMMLAWRVQAEQHGGLDAVTRRMLRQPASLATHKRPLDGVKVVREWQGERHEVTVLAGGIYQYRDSRYRSLSKIAREITGKQWNGPRFFGLRADGGKL